MRRVCVMAVSVSLVVALGCGGKHYEARMERTLQNMETGRRIKKNLMDPPGDKKFAELSIYIRPPKEEAQAPAGQLPAAEGQFDLNASFVEGAGAALHVLARVKMPRKPPTKGAPPPPPPPPRGAFDADVLGVLAAAFNSPEALQSPKFRAETRKDGNSFRRLNFAANDKEVNLYIYKHENHDVALVFVYDPKVKNALSTKIELCLDTFATGPAAARQYAGAAPEEAVSTPAAPL